MEKLQIKGNVEIRANEPENTKPDTPDNKDKTPDKATTDELKLGGYAIMFDEPSEVMTTEDGTKFTETVSADALQGVDLSHLILLSDHDYKQPLASVDAGTLTATIDEKGLAFEAKLDPSVSYANDVYNNVKNGNISKMSFGFQIADNGDSWKKNSDGSYSRTITKISQLYELSVCVLPAYSETEVSTRSLEKFISDNSKEKDNKTMEKTLIKPQDKENTEVRSFEKYVKTAGEVRDGLNTDVDGKAIIPTQIVTPIYKSKVGSNDLAAYVDVKKVSVGQGSYPIAKNDPSKVLATKAELAQIGDTDSGMTAVDFKCETRAGKVYLSQELLDDSAVDFKSEIQSQLSTLVKNTDNFNILNTLKGVPTKTVKTLDDVKALRNSLDFGLTPVVITNNDGFAYLDNLKDSQGRYILQPDVTIASGKSLFGCPIVVMNNKVLPDIKAGQFPIFIGDLQEAVALIRRNQITSSWTQFDSYSEGLAVIYRSDYKLKNADAVVAMTLATQD